MSSSLNKHKTGKFCYYLSLQSFKIYRFMLLFATLYCSNELNFFMNIKDTQNACFQKKSLFSYIRHESVRQHAIRMSFSNITMTFANKRTVLTLVLSHTSYHCLEDFNSGLCWCPAQTQKQEVGMRGMRRGVLFTPTTMNNIIDLVFQEHFLERKNSGTRTTKYQT